MDGQPGGQSYSPSSMQYFQHPQQHAPPESYRASPQQHEQTSSSSHAAPHLPPIQHFEGQMMQSQQYGAAPLNAQIPPPPHAHHHHVPPYQPAQYQYPNGMPSGPMPSNVGANGQNGGMMRFPIPPQAGMHQPNARPKGKDIKRRTKTGCLTCRKRRIKCDEGHPSCRNCQKSKRECLGYDPIFKQQPGPALIQPAPSATSSVKTETSPRPSSTLPPSPYQQSQAYPGAGGAFGPARNSRQSADGQVEYGASLDPALGSGSPPFNMAANNYNNDLRPVRRAKHISMDQLFCINDVPPRYEVRQAPPSNSPIPQQDVNQFYKFHFAPGLDRLFETSWYSDRGLQYIQHNGTLLDFIMQVMEQMKQRTDDLASTQNMQSLEARLVWQLAVMPRSPSPTQRSNGASNDSLTTELLPRIETLENLLTGQFLPPSEVPPPPTPDHQSDAQKYNQHLFWNRLGRFTSIRDDTADPASYRDIPDSFNVMRGILSMLENRDVLYSLAIMRHYGGRMADWCPPRPVVPKSDDQQDESKKLQIAHVFLGQQDLKGTTQVVQRICGMGLWGMVLLKRE